MSYVSEMNKNKNAMNILNNQLMKNIKIKFEEENTSIKFENYYFNGVPSPTDIEIKNIQNASFEIKWNQYSFYKNKIKFITELIKEN